MRTIEFRGKTADGRWRYGNYNQIGVNHVILPKEGIFESVTNYLIDPNTLGQYIEISDKNGKKIFEGDIVQIDPKVFDHRGVVLFRSGGFEIVDWNDESEVFYYFSSQLEVLGNIYENLELLRGDEDA